MGIFDNAKTVMIGNKEVQSITTNDGGKLYEKPQPTPVSDNYDLTFSTNKSIISYAHGESTTVTATLTNNNVPVPNEHIRFDWGNWFFTSLTYGDYTSYAGSNFEVSDESILSDDGATFTTDEDKLCLSVELPNWFHFATSCIKTSNTYLRMYIGGNNGDLLLIQDGYCELAGTTFDLPSGVSDDITVDLYYLSDRRVLEIDGEIVIEELWNSPTPYWASNSIIFEGSSDEEWDISSVTVDKCASGVTNQNGVATVQVNSENFGDIHISGTCWEHPPQTFNLLVIEDCYIFDDATSTPLSSFWNTSGTINITEYGYELPKSDNRLYLKQPIDGEYRVEYKSYKHSNTTYPIRFAFYSPNGAYTESYHTTFATDRMGYFGLCSSSGMTWGNEYATIRVDVPFYGAILYHNGQRVCSKSTSVDFVKSGYLFGWKTDSNIAQYVKDIKIKRM